LESGAQVFFFL